MRKLIEGLDVAAATGGLDIDIKGVSADSRKILPGELYVALRGGVHDGHDYLKDAVKKGASAVVVEDCPGRLHEETGCPVVCVDNTRKALSGLSANFYGRPSEGLNLIGVTGTNGKTTTTYIIKSILEAAGMRTGLIGTIGYTVGERDYPAPYTTPEAVDFQRLLSEMRDAGLTHVVSEVSSHALAQGRVDGSVFKAAVFSNLTRDHLDFHLTMEDYFDSKKRLFKELLRGVSVVNKDDPYGKMLIQSIDGRVITYGIEGDPDLKALDIKNKPDGMSFVITGGGMEIKVESPLIGIPNAYNILSAASAALSLGIGRDAVKEGISRVRGVKGRFEKIDIGQDFLCVVDYAHTEDALRRLIMTARGASSGRVIAVFGCGGERDRGKRPAMGAAATGLSDAVFITSDNPRGEDPAEIIREIVKGAVRKNYSIVPDRKEAIKEAVSIARASDIVLIAGKGHEDYQEISGLRHPFSDKSAAEEAIRERLKE